MPVQPSYKQITGTRITGVRSALDHQMLVLNPHEIMLNYMFRSEAEADKARPGLEKKLKASLVAVPAGRFWRLTYSGTPYEADREIRDGTE